MAPRKSLVDAMKVETKEVVSLEVEKVEATPEEETVEATPTKNDTPTMINGRVGPRTYVSGRGNTVVVN